MKLKGIAIHAQMKPITMTVNGGTVADDFFKYSIKSIEIREAKR